MNQGVLKDVSKFVELNNALTSIARGARQEEAERARQSEAKQRKDAAEEQKETQQK